VATGATVTLQRIIGFRSPEFEPIYKTPKATLISVYEMEDGVPLMIINFHGINFSGASKLKNQLESLRSTIKAFNGRKIFAGDFNTWSYSRQKVVLNFTKEMGFTEVDFKREITNQLPLDRVFLHGCQAVEAKVLTEIISSDHAPLKVQVACP
jgi:endonuclease/exonuclease/phosphatase (EEP) superfamily protein YafD